MEYEGTAVSSLMCFPALSYTRGVYSSSTDDTLERCRLQTHSGQATRLADSEKWTTERPPNINTWRSFLLKRSFKHAVKYLG